MSRALLLCLLLVFVPIGATMPVAATDDQPECGTTVRHEAFRTDNTTITEAKNGTATSVVDNTEVSLDTNVAFVHLSAKNPNGYCVRYVVDISPEVIDPAELGHIEANNGTETATWRAIHDFDTDQTYSKVEFVLQGGEEATFAPSKLRVQSLQWTGKANNATSGWLPDIGLSSVFGSDELEQRKYTFSAENNSDRVSIVLSNESLGKEVEEYQAVYRTDDRGWTPVGTDSDDPVYLREVNGGNVVEFYFNDPDAKVEFTANPTFIDKRRHSVRSYMSGVESIRDLLPLSAGGSTAFQAVGLPLAVEVSQ